MKNKIYIKHWLALKPKDYSSNTDFYYLKVANKINANLNPSLNLTLSQFIEKDDILLLSCFITCYFEDIISQTNIWSTYKLAYKNLYNKKLPFYNIDDRYVDDEINFEDVAFLTWYFLNTIQQDKFINPLNDFILIIARFAMQILEEEYEYAPENKNLKTLFTFKNNDDDFYKSRKFIQLVFFESYLFFTDIKQQLDYEILDLLEEHRQENEASPGLLMSYIREYTEDYTFNKRSSLLALKAKDWTAQLLGSSHPLYKNITNITDKIFGLFLYKSQNENFVNLEYIASGMRFEMTKKSFDHYEELKKDEIVYIGLVKWKNEWWFSGNFTVSDFDADVILDQKNSADARSKVNSLNNPLEIQEILNVQEKAFLKYNNNTPIAFIKSNEVEKFTSNFMDYYNDSLKLSIKKQKEAKQNTKDDGYFGTENTFKDFNSEEQEAIVFFNPKNGIEIYFDIINAFPDKNNPFYTEESEGDIMHLLISPEYSTEFVYYFINTYKDQLSFFEREPYKSYLEDIDFLLKFWKKDSYFTKSSLIITGKKNKLSIS
ncbi:hypothetical protein A8C32_10145 [Flavivirga aquatica]|uniref:DUF3843 family protein n=1 Tax=Flavivirga aquatica TaxID=1849968 RepID=A0A1E5TES4_9FLAO|nr:DUF3843 family protein [Flavivirga aquatica]OEK09861.1 hypothetical protein A8C32_10145 [Flavivirga aquatica]